MSSCLFKNVIYKLFACKSHIYDILILDEAVCISHSANILGKGNHPAMSNSRTDTTF